MDDNRYDETHKTWNKIAQLYEDVFMDLKLYDDTYHKFCTQITKTDASLLEIGCGPGNITRYLLNYNPKFKILATDVSKNMVDLAIKNNSSVDHQIIDCRNIGNLKSKFDGIICGFIIPYLKDSDLLNLIADIHDLLYEGGILYLSFVVGKYKNSKYISGSTGDRTFFYYYNLEKIKKTLEKEYLSITNIIEKEYQRSDGKQEIHVIVIAKK